MIKSSRGCFGKEELLAVEEAFRYGYFGMAYKVTEFEQSLKDYLGTEYEVLATNTGTSALHLALSSLGIGPGDEVIVPAFTFVASVQAIAMCGATPVLCEVHEENLLIDVKDAERKITDKTKAVITVDYSGNPCDYDALFSLKDKYGIRIIEDAAHSIGSLYNGKRIGSFGDVICFSFDSIKVMSCGEGGAIVSNDKEMMKIAEQKRLLGMDKKTHALDWKQRSWVYDVNYVGFRYHMSNINAAIGCEQLKKLDRFIARRREICHQYVEELSSVSEISIIEMDYDVIAPFMFPCLILNGQRDRLREYLVNKDIETAISYIPSNKFTLFKNVNMPVTDKIYNEILCLPLHFEISDDDVREVCACIRKFYQELCDKS